MARTAASIAPWADEVVEQSGLVSLDELERLSDDSCCYELVAGWLVKLSPGSGGHGSLSPDLAAELHLYVKARRLGLVLGAETGFTLSPTGSPRPTVLAPDISFVRADRLPAKDSDAWDQFWRLA